MGGAYHLDQSGSIRLSVSLNLTDIRWWLETWTIKSLQMTSRLSATMKFRRLTQIHRRRIHNSTRRCLEENPWLHGVYTASQHRCHCNQVSCSIRSNRWYSWQWTRCTNVRHNFYKPSYIAIFEFRYFLCLIGCMLTTIWSGTPWYCRLVLAERSASVLCSGRGINVCPSVAYASKQLVINYQTFDNTSRSCFLALKRAKKTVTSVLVSTLYSSLYFFVFGHRGHVLEKIKLNTYNFSV